MPTTNRREVEPTLVFTNQVERWRTSLVTLAVSLVHLAGALSAWVGGGSTANRVRFSVVGILLGAVSVWSLCRWRLVMTESLVVWKSPFRTTRIDRDEVRSWRLVEAPLGPFTRTALVVDRADGTVLDLGLRGVSAKGRGRRRERLRRAVAALDREHPG